MTVSFDEFWGINYYNHPPLTDEMVLVAEERLGVNLPKLFVELLKIQNGGYTKENLLFPTLHTEIWSSGYATLDRLSGIVLDELADSALNILDTEYMTKEWDLPNNQVLLAGDGHSWLTLDYRDGKTNPSIAWIDVDSEYDVQLADNFDSFFAGLIKGENE